MDLQRSVHPAVKEQLLCLWFLITKKEVQHHIGHIGYWGWYESLKLMFLTTGASGKGRQPPPRSSLWGFKLVSSLTCCQVHTCRESATSLLLSSLSKLNAWSTEVLWNSDLTFHFKWFNFDSETSSGNDQKALFINWELYIQGCTLSGPSGITQLYIQKSQLFFWTKLYPLLLDRKLNSWLNGGLDDQSFSKMPGTGSPMLTLSELLSS